MHVVNLFQNSYGVHFHHAPLRHVRHQAESFKHVTAHLHPKAIALFYKFVGATNSFVFSHLLRQMNRLSSSDVRRNQVLSAVDAWYGCACARPTVDGRVQAVEHVTHVLVIEIKALHVEVTKVDERGSYDIGGTAEMLDGLAGLTWQRWWYEWLCWLASALLKFDSTSLQVRIEVVVGRSFGLVCGRGFVAGGEMTLFF